MNDYLGIGKRGVRYNGIHREGKRIFYEKAISLKVAVKVTYNGYTKFVNSQKISTILILYLYNLYLYT